MSGFDVLDISREGIYLLLKISLPMLLAALVVGLLVSLFQALTQIQETTLSFVPKILVVFGVLVLSMGFIGSQMMIFTEHIMSMIVHVE